MLNYIIWNVAPYIAKIGSFEIHWYSILFAAGFFFGYKVLVSIYKSEGRPESNVEQLAIYMFLATLIGARVGHCIFYDWEYFQHHLLEIILPVQFEPEFEFTGFRGLASHGAALGILAALWIYARKNKDQSYLYVLDRMAIVVLLAGACIRTGNLMNSEIIGKPSNAPTSFIFAYPMKEQLQQVFKKENVKDVRFKESGKDTLFGGLPARELTMTLTTKRIDSAQSFVEYKVWSAIFNSPHYPEHIAVSSDINKKTFKSMRVIDNKTQEIEANVYGIPRHPAQLFEALSCFILFILLYALYKKKRAATPEGRIFGIFMITLFTLRFFYEYLKENQSTFENNMSLNMGQWLSIPMVLIGIFVLIRSFKAERLKPNA